MMLGENDFALKVQLSLQLRLHPYFVFDPKRNGFEKGINPARRVGEVRMQDAVKLYKRLLIERYIIEFISCDAALVQAVVDGVARKPRIVFLSRESFLLCCRDDFTITHQASRAIVVVCGNAKYVNILA